MKLSMIGAAFGIGGFDHRSSDAPDHYQDSKHLAELKTVGISYHWLTTVYEEKTSAELPAQLETTITSCAVLANITYKLTKEQRRFCVIGGDHSCAIGTWSGVTCALEEDLGLIWVDAHMDAHTHDTTQTGNIHGMPVASLLGKGRKELSHIASPKQKIKPENLCLVGIRDYEKEEADLLHSLGVKVFTADDVQKMGIDNVMQQAREIVTKNTKFYGLSIDLDGLDPSDAPGTGTPVAQGINAEEFIKTLTPFATDKRLLGYEITEFNPHLDIDEKTEVVMTKIIKALEGDLV